MSREDFDLKISDPEALRLMLAVEPESSNAARVVVIWGTDCFAARATGVRV